MKLIIILAYILIFLIETIELKLSKEDFRIYVKNVASVFHNNWRQHYLSEHPSVKNRFKLTNSGQNYQSSDFIYPMILTVGFCLVHRNLKVARDRSNSSITYVDILNMNYEELPNDWAYENRATARVACLQVLKGVRQKRLFDKDFIENISAKIHIEWIKRNKYRTTDQLLLLSYADLPEFEKDKDRRAILIACRLFNQLHLYRKFKTKPIHLIEHYNE